MMYSMTEEKSEMGLRERKISCILRWCMTLSGLPSLLLLTLSSVREGNAASREETEPQVMSFPFRMSWSREIPM